MMSEFTKGEIQSLINFDPLSEAENVTGQDYKCSDDTTMLGMLLALENNYKKKCALSASGDSHFSSTLDEYLTIITNYGFKKALEIPLDDEPDNTRNKLYIFWHPLGILLKFDTYYGNKVNGGAFYYNIKPFDNNAPHWPVTSSGGFKETEKGMVWVGNHDCREAIIFHIERLKEWGEFLPQWVDAPFLWLLHYQDTRSDDYDYSAINSERIAMLPNDVRKAISGESL